MNEQTKAAAAASYCGTLPATDQPVNQASEPDPNISDNEEVWQKDPSEEDQKRSEQKTRRAIRPFRSTVHATKTPDPVQLPPIMHFMTEAKTANEMMREFSELDQNSFMNNIMVLMRLGFVSAVRGEDDELRFISKLVG